MLFEESKEFKEKELGVGLNKHGVRGMPGEKSHLGRVISRSVISEERLAIP
jgi:hypothetical protein